MACPACRRFAMGEAGDGILQAFPARIRLPPPAARAYPFAKEWGSAMPISAEQKSAILDRITKDELAQLTKDLVDIPSPTGHERGMGEFMLDWFRKNGLAAIRQDVAPGRVNAVGI